MHYWIYIPCISYHINFALKSLEGKGYNNEFIYGAWLVVLKRVVCVRGHLKELVSIICAAW